MREEIDGRSSTRQILGARERLDERADVGDKGRVIAVEEGLNIGQVRIEREVRRGRQREQSVLRQRQVAAERRVFAVARGVKGNERIVGIVAAEEKHADQRLVAGAALGQSVERAKGAKAEGVACGGEACVPDKASPGGSHSNLPWKKASATAGCPHLSA